jgi:hypothetical protein
VFKTMVFQDVEASSPITGDALRRGANGSTWPASTARCLTRGETWAISVPTATVGPDFYTGFVSDVQRVICPFRMNTAELFVELIVTRSAGQ